MEMTTRIIILRFIDCVLPQCLCKLLLALCASTVFVQVITRVVCFHSVCASYYSRCVLPQCLCKLLLALCASTVFVQVITRVVCFHSVCASYYSRCVLPQCLCKLLLALCASTVFVQIITRVGRIYCTMYIVQPQYIVQRILYIIQLYSAYRTLTLHYNIYFYNIHDLQG